MKVHVPVNYQQIVTALKNKIRSARLQATLRLNADLLAIYREIGVAIAEQEREAGWGAKVVENLSRDLKSEFQDMKGLSPRNLRYMRDFAVAYPHFPLLQAPLAKMPENGTEAKDEVILQAPLAKLSWYHHITLLVKVKEEETRTFYIQQTIQNGWSRDVMVHQIEGGLHQRLGQLTHNFAATTDQSELITQVFKDPYKFDFIYLGREAKERDLEDALTSQLKKFLLELGQFFSFMGEQYRVVLGEKEYFYDLLFYHTKLKRYVIIDLKIGEFKPEFVGKMEFYLTLADEQLRDEKDDRSIGLILCKTKDGLVAEYALRDSKKAIGISEYKINENLPENIQGELPSIKDIEQSMEEELKTLQSHTEKRMEDLLQKLASLHREEVKTPVTYPLLCALYDKSICPLFEYLLVRLHEFDQYFLASNHFWSFEKSTTELSEFEQQWKNEEILKRQQEPFFLYRLNGLKKAGVDAFDTVIQISIRLNQYQYGIKLINYNNQQPFIEKLYEQALTKEEMQMIGDTISKQILQHIEGQIEFISRDKRDTEEKV
jgi:predicted nuclease of restriction endonuclease-like (RecB) superfamily